MNAEELLKLKHELRFRKDGRFRILMMSDLHGGVGCSEQLPVGIDAVVESTKPDLVLLCGDIAGPGRIHVETEEQLRELLLKVARPMEQRRIPWAHVFGNHDDNFGLSVSRQETVYEEFSYCISKYGEKKLSGAANYVLPVKASSCDKIVFNVFGLDSHSSMNEFSAQYGLPKETAYVLTEHFCLGRGYDTVHFDQIMWYYKASETLEQYNGTKIPALMYFHIPPPEFCLIDRNRSETHYEGSEGENVGCGELNSGLFSACLQRGDVKTIICGHDHINDFTGTYCGILLGYDAGMDYDAYQTDALRGARVFDIDEKDPWHLTTYMARVADIMGKPGNRKKW